MPARLDPRLRAAALKIAGAELAHIGCKRRRTQLCCRAPQPVASSASSLEHSAQLLRSAQKQRRDLPRACPPTALRATRSTTQARCCGRCARAAKPPAVAGRTAAQAEFRTSRRDVVAGRRAAADRRGHAGHAAAARIPRAAVCWQQRSSACSICCWRRRMVLAPALGEAGGLVFRRWASSSSERSWRSCCSRSCSV